MKRENKSTAYEKELYARIDEVIHYIWDPIHVSRSAGARSEYSSFVPKIVSFVLLDDAQGLDKYLKHLSEEVLQTGDDPESRYASIGIILEWKKYLDDMHKIAKRDIG